MICRQNDGDAGRSASDSEAHVGRMCPPATTLGPGLALKIRQVRAHFVEKPPGVGLVLVNDVNASY